MKKSSSTISSIKQLCHPSSTWNLKIQINKVILKVVIIQYLPIIAGNAKILNHYLEFHHLSLCCVMPRLNVNIRMFQFMQDHWVVHFVFCGLCVHMYFVSLEKWKLHKSSLSVFILLFDTHTSYQHSLPSAYLFKEISNSAYSRKDWKEHELWVALFFPLFFLCHNFQYQ